jgi:hypothetical protein
MRLGFLPRYSRHDTDINLRHGEAINRQRHRESVSDRLESTVSQRVFPKQGRRECLTS